jgi:hypothetical protein
VDLYDEAKAAVDALDKDEFKAVIADGKALIEEFKEKAREVIPEEEWDDVRHAINDALDENEEYLKDLHKQAVDLRRVHYLHLFDKNVCRHQRMINKLEKRGLNVDELQEKLDAIADKRDELEDLHDAAYDSCYPTHVWLCDTEEAKALSDFVEGIHEDFVALRGSIKDLIHTGIGKKATDILDKAIAAEERRIAKLKDAGADVTELSAKLDKIKAMVETAKGHLEDGEIDLANKEMQAAKEALRELHKEINQMWKDLFGEKLRVMKKEIEQAKEKLRAKKKLAEENPKPESGKPVAVAPEDKKPIAGGVI